MLCDFYFFIFTPLESIQIHIRHAGGICVVRVFVVSRQRAVAKTQTEIDERSRDQGERIPKRIPGNINVTVNYRGLVPNYYYQNNHLLVFPANLQDDTAIHNR